MKSKEWQSKYQGLYIVRCKPTSTKFNSRLFVLLNGLYSLAFSPIIRGVSVALTVIQTTDNKVTHLIYCLDPVYTVPDSRSHDIEFGQFEVIFTLTAFSMISCC